MRILIDARMYGLEHAGIGRYVENLIQQLQVVDKVNEYIILQNQNSKINPDLIGVKTQYPNSKFKTIIADIKHYSFAEQIRLPKILNSLDFDIAHFPHFNVPVFFRKPFVVTIHDLIKHTSRGMQTTTRNPLIYWAKYAGYKTVFGNAVRRAKKIIVPSQAVKEDLLKNYKISPEKIQVIYEGVGKEFQISNFKFQMSNKVLKKYKIKQPYVIYTGSAYPHKNLVRLIESIAMMNNVYQSIESKLGKDLNLVIASTRNVFLNRLERTVERYGMQQHVKFLGFIPDEELAVLYKNAKAFVFPSLSEGFGLPGLEAMTSGCPVICSDIPVFHEIYGDAATYFNPTNTTDMANKIRLILADGKLREDMVSKGKERAKIYSWRKMAQETLKVYKKAI